MTRAAGEAPSLEDVLEAFSLEPATDGRTLQRYLHDYPEYAEDLVDLSLELNRPVDEYDGPLTAAELALVADAWQQHVEATPALQRDPFGALSVEAQRELARQLGVPRQVITAFREQRVALASVPRKVCVMLASALNTSVDAMVAMWAAAPSDALLARSYKADVKPSGAVLITFEQLLIDAGVPEEKRAELMDGAS